MASRFICDFSNMQPTESPAGASIENVYVDSERRKVIKFDASTQQSASFQFRVPDDYSANFTIVYQYIMASGTSGNTQWRCEVEAITPNSDTVDLDSAVSYDTANDAASDTVPGTAGHLAEISDELANGDSAAIGDLVRVRITYLTASTASGDAYLMLAEILDDA